LLEEEEIQVDKWEDEKREKENELLV